jgi:hypothetical protein
VGCAVPSSAQPTHPIQHGREERLTVRILRTPRTVGNAWATGRGRDVPVPARARVCSGCVWMRCLRLRLGLGRWKRSRIRERAGHGCGSRRVGFGWRADGQPGFAASRRGLKSCARGPRAKRAREGPNSRIALRRTRARFRCREPQRRQANTRRARVSCLVLPPRVWHAARRWHKPLGSRQTRWC